MWTDTKDNLSIPKNKDKDSVKKEFSDKEKKELVELLYDDFLNIQILDEEDKKVKLKKRLNKPMPIPKDEYKAIKKLVIKETGDLLDKTDQEDIQKAIDLFYAGTSKKENKEIADRIPELEEKNFHIEMEERDEREDKNGIKYKLKLPEKDVREYLEWPYRWEQLFTHAAAIRETAKAKKKLPATWKVYRDIIQKKYKWNYNAEWKWNDFVSGENIISSRSRDKNDRAFDTLGPDFRLWCEDWSYIHGNKYWWDWKWSNYKDYAVSSVRCVK